MPKYIPAGQTSLCYMDYLVIGVLSWKHDLCSEVITYSCSHSLHILIIDLLFFFIKSVTNYGPESSPISCMDFILVFSCVISHLQTDCSNGPQVLPQPTGKIGLQSPPMNCAWFSKETQYSSGYITDTENTTYTPGHLTKSMKWDSPPETLTWAFPRRLLSSL